MKINLVLIGCGSFSRFVHGPAHRENARHFPWIHLAACCDSDLAKAQAYARDFGFARAYQRVDEMLQQERPDAVFLVVPPAVTAKVAGEILKQGYPLFLEKPPGLESRELSHLIALANKANIPTQVGFNRRYMPLIAAGKAILDQRFSRISQVDYQLIRYHRDEPDFSSTAIHALDAALYLAGSPYHNVKFHYQDIETESGRTSSLSLQAQCAHDTQIRINIQPMSGYVAETVTVHGYGQTLTIDLGSGELENLGQILYYEKNRLVHQQRDSSSSPQEKQGIVHELRSFCQALRDHATPSPALHECTQQVALMAAIRQHVAALHFPEATCRSLA